MMTSILKPFLGFTLTFTCAISAHAEELAKKTCLIVGTEQAVEESAACPGTVAEVLRSIEIEKERPMRDADGKIVIGTDGNAVLEQYTETYKLMASFAASAGLGDAMNGGEVPKLHNGMLENNTITVFAIKDSILAAKVEDAIATAKSNSATPLTVKDKTLIIHKIVGSQIATRPYYKDNMWNGQMEYKSLGGDPIKTNFLREDGDIANGMPFQQMDVLASNGVIHLMN